MDIKQIHEERHSLLREKDSLLVKTDQISEMRIKIIDNRLTELQILVDEDVQKNIVDQEQKNVEVEEERKMSENPKDVVKSKLAAVSKEYDGLVIEYRALNQKQDDIRAKKDVLREQRDKLYGLKKKDVLTPEEQAFVDSVEV